MTGKIDWQRVRRLARARYKQLQASPGFRDKHPGHAVARALGDVSARFDIGFGVEGWARDPFGRRGVDYINMGDPYELTVCVTTTPTGARFHVTCWATFAGRERG